MSAPKFRLELTKPARLDFRDILSYTSQMWGERQLVEYKSKIDAALSAIAQNPNIGHTQHKLLVYPAGKHLIYYRIEAATVYVVRILHERMDAARHLDDLA